MPIRTKPESTRPPDVAPAVAVLRRRRLVCPPLAIVLGSGFSAVTEAVSRRQELPYDAIPGFPATGVPGHRGKLVVGELGGTSVALLAGRAHFYEGHDLAAVTYPIRVLAAWGVGTVLLTNAAGGINRSFRPGDFMILTDHINFMGVNPLRTNASPAAHRFVDLSRVYDARLQHLLRRAARASGATVHPGVYLAVSGPSYETPAEIRAFARLGADAVGMSTVPEAIVARQCGLRVAGLSCITNLAAGRSRQPITHQEVLEIGRKSEQRATRLLTSFARLWERAPG